MRSRTEAYTRLAARLAKAQTPEDYTAIYVAFRAEKPRDLRADDQPAACHHETQPAAAAAPSTRSSPRRCGFFARDIELPSARRRAVMKVYITLYGGISLYAAGVLDQPSEKALIAELSAMNARM